MAVFTLDFKSCSEQDLASGKTRQHKADGATLTLPACVDVEMKASSHSSRKAQISSNRFVTEKENLDYLLNEWSDGGSVGDGAFSPPVMANDKAVSNTYYKALYQALDEIGGAFGPVKGSSDLISDLANSNLITRIRNGDKLSPAELAQVNKQFSAIVRGVQQYGTEQDRARNVDLRVNGKYDGLYGHNTRAYVLGVIADQQKTKAQSAPSSSVATVPTLNNTRLPTTSPKGGGQRKATEQSSTTQSQEITAPEVSPALLADRIIDASEGVSDIVVDLEQSLIDANRTDLLTESSHREQFPGVQFLIGEGNDIAIAEHITQLNNNGTLNLDSITEATQIAKNAINHKTSGKITDYTRAVRGLEDNGKKIDLQSRGRMLNQLEVIRVRVIEEQAKVDRAMNSTESVIEPVASASHDTAVGKHTPTFTQKSIVEELKKSISQVQISISPFIRRGTENPIQTNQKNSTEAVIGAEKHTSQKQTNPIVAVDAENPIETVLGISLLEYYNNGNNYQSWKDLVPKIKNKQELKQSLSELKSEVQSLIKTHDIELQNINNFTSTDIEQMGNRAKNLLLAEQRDKELFATDRLLKMLETKDNNLAIGYEMGAKQALERAKFIDRTSRGLADYYKNFIETNGNSNVTEDQFFAQLIGDKIQPTQSELADIDGALKALAKVGDPITSTIIQGSITSTIGRGINKRVKELEKAQATTNATSETETVNVVTYDQVIDAAKPTSDMYDTILGALLADEGSQKFVDDGRISILGSDTNDIIRFILDNKVTDYKTMVEKRNSAERKLSPLVEMKSMGGRLLPDFEKISSQLTPQQKEKIDLVAEKYRTIDSFISNMQTSFHNEIDM